MYAWFYETQLDADSPDYLKLTQLTPWVPGKHAARRAKDDAVAIVQEMDTPENGAHRLRCVQSIHTGYLKVALSFFEEHPPAPKQQTLDEKPANEKEATTPAPEEAPAPDVNGIAHAYENNGNRVWCEDTMVWLEWGDNTFFKQYGTHEDAVRIRRKLIANNVSAGKRPTSLLKGFEQMDEATA